MRSFKSFLGLSFACLFLSTVNGTGEVKYTPLQNEEEDTPLLGEETPINEWETSQDFEKAVAELAKIKLSRFKKLGKLEAKNLLEKALAKKPNLSIKNAIELVKKMAELKKETAVALMREYRDLNAGLTFGLGHNPEEFRNPTPLTRIRQEKRDLIANEMLTPNRQVEYKAYIEKTYEDKELGEALEKFAKDLKQMQMAALK